MAEESQSRTSKERSPNFPFISLGRALERVRQFYKHEKRGAAPFKVAAEHWSYSPSSSGALQTAAALKQYGLLADVDAGKDRKVRLTDLALRILLDTREDSSERDQLKRQAALTPPVAAEIYKKYPDGLPSEGTLNHFLVLDRDFNPQTAVKVIRILKENEGLTIGVGERTISDDMRTEEDSWSMHAVSDIQTGRARVAEALLERQVPRVAPKPIGSFQHGGVTITINADGPVTQDTIGKLAKFVELIKDGFPKSLPQAASDDSDTQDVGQLTHKPG